MPLWLGTCDCEQGRVRLRRCCFPCPASPQGVVSSEGIIPRTIGRITRVALEIGYVEGDLYATIGDNLEASDRNVPLKRYDGTRIPLILPFNEINEGRGSADSEVLFYVEPKRLAVKGEAPFESYG